MEPMRHFLIAVVVLLGLIDQSDAVCNDTFPGTYIYTNSTGGLSWAVDESEAAAGQSCYWLLIAPDFRVIRYSFSSFTANSPNNLTLNGAYWFTYVDHLSPEEKRERFEENDGMADNLRAYNNDDTRFPNEGAGLTASTWTPMLQIAVDNVDGGSMAFSMEWEVGDSECILLSQSAGIGGFPESNYVLANETSSLEYPSMADKYAPIHVCMRSVIVPPGKMIRWRVAETAMNPVSFLAFISDTGDYAILQFAENNTYRGDFANIASADELLLIVESSFSRSGDGWSIEWDLYDEACLLCFTSGGDCVDSDADDVLDYCQCGNNTCHSSNLLSGCDIPENCQQGALGTWSEWGCCHEDNSTRYRERPCNNPMPIGDPNFFGCTGADLEEEECSVGPFCPNAVCNGTFPGTYIHTNSTGGLSWSETAAAGQSCYWLLIAPDYRVIRYSFSSLTTNSPNNVTLNGAYWYLDDNGDLTPEQIRQRWEGGFDEDDEDFMIAYYNDETRFPNEGAGLTAATWSPMLQITADNVDGGSMAFSIEWEVGDTECLLVSQHRVDDIGIPETSYVFAGDTSSLEYPSLADKYAPVHYCIRAVYTPPGKMMRWRITERDMNPDSAVVFYSDTGEVSILLYDEESVYYTDPANVGNADEILAVVELSFGRSGDGWAIEWDLYDDACLPCFTSGGDCVDSDADTVFDYCQCGNNTCHSSNLLSGCDIPENCQQGAWGAWSEWGCCHKDNSTRYRERPCNNPEPIGDPNFFGCTGADQEEEECSVGPFCPTATCNGTFPGTYIVADETGSLIWSAETSGATSAGDSCFWLIIAPDYKVIRYSFSSLTTNSPNNVTLNGAYWFLNDNYDLTPDQIRQRWEGGSGDGTDFMFAYYNDETRFPNEGAGLTAATWSPMLQITADNVDGGSMAFSIEWEVGDSECLLVARNNGASLSIPEANYVFAGETSSLEYPSLADKYAPLHVCIRAIFVPPGKMMRWRITERDMNPFSAAVFYSDTGEVSILLYDEETVYYTDPANVGNADEILAVYDVAYSRSGDGWAIEWDLYDDACLPCFTSGGDCVDSDADTVLDYCQCGNNTCHSSNLLSGCDIPGNCQQGAWETWNEWNCCHSENSTRYRERACNNPEPIGDLDFFDCPGDAVEEGACSSEPFCPIDGDVGEWSTWTCDPECGGEGNLLRSRSCDSPAPLHGGSDCNDALAETGETCNNGPCPIDGGVGTWSAWSTCPVSCGGGTQTRSRACDNPSPQHGGSSCSEPLTESGACNEAVCPCDACEGDGGTCVDSDLDGTNDACSCPSRLCSTDLANGCDVACAGLGEFCIATDDIPCKDENAICTYSSDLTGKTYCKCKFGYVEVAGEPPVCHEILVVPQDAACQTCIDNHGVCYDSDDDGQKDGCVCPPTRVTVSQECDTLLFEVTCDASSITLCYDHHSVAEHQALFAKLDDRTALLFARGFFHQPDCYFMKVSNEYCLSLTYDDSDPNCGLHTSDRRRLLHYSFEACLQKDVIFQSSDDINVLAYCSFDKINNIASGDVDVLGRKIAGVEGDHIRAVLQMRLLDDEDQDLHNVGIVAGGDMRIEIAMTEDAGVYTDLRAELCLISDKYNLQHPGARAMPILVDACPKDPPLTANFAQTSAGVIESGSFPAPKFPSSIYLFVHCAVKICIDSADCQVPSCGVNPVKRRRRFVHEELDTKLIDMMEAPGMDHKIVAVRIVERNDEIEQDNQRELNGDVSSQLWLWLPSVILSVTIVSVVLGLLGLLCMCRSKANYAVSLEQVA